jgi:predicted nucleic acid-binding protein
MVSLNGHRAYLDANTIIYALEGFAQYTNLKTGLLDPLDAGAFIAVTSEITLVETVIGPRKAGRANDEAVFRTFLTPSASLLLEPVSMAILEKVIDLRAQFGFKIPDTIHLATGILAGCTVFVTRDASWGKTGVPVVEPQDVV